jgi:heme a synthase
VKTINSMKGTKPIILWLLSGFFLVYIMILVGGITRLTGSGLSMAEWKPIMGVLPPLNSTEWLDKFELYKKTPEFIIKNNHFNLNDFKSIFWWEFFHRNLGRLVGLIFIFPFIFFWKMKMLKKRLLKNLFVLLFLGTFQGILGWYMVYSGLIDKPYVSHLRLAAHFINALAVLSLILWIILDLKNIRKKHSSSIIKPIGLIILSILTIQLTYGALTAGLDAGYGQNRLYSLIDFPIKFQHIINHSLTVVFIHKYLGIFILMCLILLKFYSKKITINKHQKKSINILFLSVVFQYILGSLTLIYSVPIVLGLLHQTGAVIVLSATIYLIHSSYEYKLIET